MAPRLLFRRNMLSLEVFGCGAVKEVVSPNEDSRC
jgi:hypothetical protein